MKESPISQRVQLALSNLGAVPMRNNVGVMTDATGRHIRFGLMNESSKVNEQFKSSDIIAPIPIVIQPYHVGRTIAVFGAFETKSSDWKLRPSDEHAQAQLRFIQLIRAHGGIADFVTNPETVAQLIGIYR